MRYIFELSSRANLEEKAEFKYESFMNFLRNVEKPWGIDKNIAIPIFDFGREHVATITLNKYFSNGIKCSLFYRYRNMLSDHASCDDRVFCEFNAKKLIMLNL